MFRRFRFVCTPDFSMYTDFPLALQINSHYRKHWLGAYWQSKGITVIPTIFWSDERSFEWCFDADDPGVHLRRGLQLTEGTTGDKVDVVVLFTQLDVNHAQILLRFL